MELIASSNSSEHLFVKERKSATLSFSHYSQSPSFKLLNSG